MEPPTSPDWKALMEERRSRGTPLTPERMRDAVEKGVPAKLRGETWMTFSGAEELMVANEGIFSMLLADRASSPTRSSPHQRSRDLAQIETDLRRSGSDEEKLQSLRRILQALTAYVPHNYPLDKLEPGLNETAFYDPTNFTFPAGTYICEVEIDPATGTVKVDSFTAVDDFGNIINPMIVEGQV